MRNGLEKPPLALYQVPESVTVSRAAGPGEAVCGVVLKGAASLFPPVTCGVLRGTLPVWPEPSNGSWKLCDLIRYVTLACLHSRFISLLVTQEWNAHENLVW